MCLLVHPSPSVQPSVNFMAYLLSYGHVACHSSLSKNHPSGQLGGRMMLWLAAKMLDGKHQRVDIHAYARAADKGFLQRRVEEDFC